jgi:hypothetical protein
VLSDDKPLRFQRPRHYLFPPAWRTRLKEIDHLLERESELREAFLTVRAVERDWEWPERLDEIVQRWPALFAGEAGYRVAEAILYGGTPNIWRRDADTNWEFVDVFEAPLPPYRSAVTSGGNNVFASRRDRSDLPKQLLALLAPGLHKRPLTHREARQRLGLNAKEFQRIVSRLRRNFAIPIRTSAEQALVVDRVFSWGRVFRRLSDMRNRKSVKYVDVPVCFASLCTGHGVKELASFGVERMRSNANEFKEMLDVVRIPRPLLLRDPPHTSLEILQFLQSLEPTPLTP